MDAKLEQERSRATKAEESEHRWKKALKEAEAATAVLAEAMTSKSLVRR